MIFKKLMLMGAVLLLGLPFTVSAAITEPSAIPSYLAGRDDLAIKRSSLDQKFKAIEEKKKLKT